MSGARLSVQMNDGQDAATGATTDSAGDPTVIGQLKAIVAAGGGGGGGTQYAEDAAHVSGNLGTMALGVRKDTAVALAGTDGDYQPPIFDADGKLWVNAGAAGGGLTDTQLRATAVPVSGPVTDAQLRATPVPVSGGGGTQYAEDAVHASGNLGTMALGVRKDTAVALAADGDYQPPIFDGVGKLWVNTGITQYAEDAAHVSADLGTMALAVRKDSAAAIATTDGDYTPLQVDATGSLRVTGGGGGQQYAEDAAHVSADLGTTALAVRRDTPTSLAGADNDYLPLTTDSTGKLWVNPGTLDATTDDVGVMGMVAHDAADSGNPVKIGAKAISASPTAVAANDRTDLYTDLMGKLLVLPYSIPENMLSGLTAAITGTSDTAVIAAQGASIRIYVTQILVTNSHATVGTVVEIKSATTVLYRGYAAPVGGGFALTFPVPLRLAANEALNAANITTGSNVYVSASGYKGA